MDSTFSSYTLYVYNVPGCVIAGSRSAFLIVETLLCVEVRVDCTVDGSGCTIFGTECNWSVNQEAHT